MIYHKITSKSEHPPEHGSSHTYAPGFLGQPLISTGVVSAREKRPVRQLENIQRPATADIEAVKYRVDSQPPNDTPSVPGPGRAARHVQFESALASRSYDELVKLRNDGKALESRMAELEAERDAALARAHRAETRASLAIRASRLPVVNTPPPPNDLSRSFDCPAPATAPPPRQPPTSASSASPFSKARTFPSLSIVPSLLSSF